MTAGSDLEIMRVRVSAMAVPETTAAWAAGMPPQIATLTTVRLDTRGGLVGVAGTASYTPYLPDLSVAETLRPFARQVIGASAHDPAAVWPTFRVDLPVAPQARSLIDVALWDLAAQAAGLPLHRYLGSTTDRIPAYASTPMLDDIPAYLAHVDELMARGYRAIKFHCWCEVDRDLALARAVRAVHPPASLRLMLDVEQRYSAADALRAGNELSDLEFDWFEAPLDDFDLEGYAALRSAVRVPILPAGNWILDERLIDVAINLRAWSRVRIDVTVCGGITPAMRIVERARAAGLLVEFQSWGYTLASTANLHAALAGGRTTYFEQAVPEAGYEFGARNPVRIESTGMVAAPAGPGLGIEMDWPEIDRGAVLAYEATG